MPQMALTEGIRQAFLSQMQRRFPGEVFEPSPLEISVLPLKEKIQNLL